MSTPRESNATGGIASVGPWLRSRVHRFGARLRGRTAAAAVTLAASALMLSLLVSEPVEAAVTNVSVVAVESEAGLANATYEISFEHTHPTTLTGVQVRFPAGYVVSNPGNNGIRCSGTPSFACAGVGLGSHRIEGTRISGQTVIFDFDSAIPSIDSPIKFQITAGITNPTAAGVIDGSGFRVFLSSTGQQATATTDVTITPGPAVGLQVSTQPGDTNIGAALTPSPVVRTVDAFGNPSALGLAAALDVTASLTGDGTLSGTTVLDIGSGDGNGEVTFGDLNVDTAQAAATLSFSADGLTGATSEPFAITCNTGVRVDETCYATIQDAIDGAASGGTVSIDAGTYTETLAINKDVTLQGASEATTIIQANALADTASAPVVDITAGVVTIQGLTLRHGNSPDDGGGIRNAGTLTLSSVTVSDNSAAASGGGIASNGVLNMTDASITGNDAGSNGGGVHSTGTLGVTSSAITGNTATGNGGGIHSGAGLTVAGSSITGNTATGDGGGIYHDSASSAVVSESSISGNGAAQSSGIGTTGTVTATHNWWGAADGPAGAGDDVSAEVQVVPWYTDAGRTTLSAAACIVDECYSSIEEAIDAATAGATIDIGAATYTETLTIDKDLTLQGEDHSTTIIQAHATEGAAADRVIDIAEGVEVSILDITIRHGVAPGGEHGGGIRNAGTLTLTSTSILNSAAVDGGGIWNSGSLDLVGAVVKENDATGSGGGIWNSGTLVIDDSDFEYNTAAIGGGIANSGTATLSNGTSLSDHTATDTGAGIFNTGILDVSGSEVLYGEAAAGGGGIHNDGGQVTITNSYVGDNEVTAGNGGGILNEGADAVLTVEDSGLQWNSATDGGAIYNTAGTVTVSESRIEDNSVSGGPEANSGITTDVPVSAALNWWDDRDGPGGDGPGEGNGVSALVTFFPWYTDSDLDETVPVACIVDECYASVQEAVNAATAGATITIGASEFTESVTIDKDLVISGEDSSDSAIQAHEDEDAATSRVITIEPGFTVTIEHVTLRHGAGVADGGGILVGAGATLHLLDVLLEYNTATANGGAIYNTGGTVDLADVVFSGNSAGSGGAIYNASGTVVLDRVEFYSNTADTSGGAIYNVDGGVFGSLDGSEYGTALFENNDATDGGAIYSTGTASEVSLGESDLADNVAANAGGGIYNVDGTVTLVSVDLSANDASGDGGGIYNDGGTLDLEAVSFEGNWTGADGGGVNNAGGSLTLENVQFVGNDADANGAGIYNTGSINGAGLSFVFNDALDDGSAIYTASGDVDVSNSHFDDNGVPAVYATGGTVTATLSWWGSPSGPGGEGDGSGEVIASIADPILYDPWCVDMFCDATSAASAADSLLDVSTTSPSAGDTVTITVTVRDEAGNVRSAGGDQVAVYLDGTLLAATDGDLTDVGDGTYTATFTPATSGTHNVRAYLGLDDSGAEIGDGETITVSAVAVDAAVALSTTGAGEAVTVTITYTSANAVPSDGTIQVTFPEAFGLDAGAIDATVSVDSAGDFVQDVTVDDEVVTITLNAILAAGDVQIVFTAGVTNPAVPGLVGAFSLATLSGGSEIQQDASFSTGGNIDPGPPNAPQSTVSADVTSALANGVGQVTVTVTVKDALGNPIQGQAVTLDDGAGNSTISAGGSTDENGVYVFTATNSSVETVTYTATATGFGTIGATDPVTFTAPTPSAGDSTVVAAPTTRVADGTQEADITVTVLDADGQPISGVTVALAQDGTADIVDDEVVTNGAGVAVFTVTSTKAETVTYTATAGGVTITQTAQVTFNPGAVDQAKTLFTDSPAGDVNANSNVTLTVTLRDQHENPVGAAGDATNVVIYLGDPDDLDEPGVLFAEGASEGQTTGDTFTATYTQGTAGTVTFYAFFGTDAARGAAIGTVDVTFTTPAPPVEPVEPSDPGTTSPGTPGDGPDVTRENEQESAPAQADTPTQVSTTAEDGSTAKVDAPAAAIPTGGKLKAAAVGNIEELTSHAPPPANVDLAMAFVLEAEDADGNEITEFDEPIALEFTVPATSVPQGATSQTLVLAFWNGTEWVEVEGAVTQNADGSYTIEASVDHFTIFAVQHQPNRGKFTPEVASTGLTLTSWGGGGYELLAAALPGGGSVWVTTDGEFTGYTVGAPAFVNAAFADLFPAGVDAGTPLVVVPSE